MTRRFKKLQEHQKKLNERPCNSDGHYYQRVWMVLQTIGDLHFLKLGSVIERLEQARLERTDTTLARAKGFGT